MSIDAALLIIINVDCISEVYHIDGKREVKLVNALVNVLVKVLVNIGAVRRKLREGITALGLLLFLFACASQSSGIGSSVTICCLEKAGQSFEVKTKDMPVFLRPLMVNNFSVAMANKGFQPVDADADLRVVLYYEQIDLTNNSAADDFEEHLSPGGDVSFIARIGVDIFAASNKKPAWSGSIQRVHHVSPGEFMHTGPAAVALLGAFEELLADLPEVSK